MKVYLAGPMRGYPEFNFPAFHDATKALREQGYTVFSPAENDINAGFDPEGDLDQEGYSLAEALEDDLVYIIREAEAVVCLEGWRESRGAIAEVHTAFCLDVPVWEIGEFLRRGGHQVEFTPLRSAE